ncbi:TetR/AcrR family transcriptional regulator [Clostridium sp. P21]|uniref:TetR/AcrR family transcriptional regulator n=1 Tax=Clostridium muellerianum TaxID=2716538 RepID=A0A7Y0EJX1_9CLOT|nr:TetR/AcrR family transcriptional regulator [Clostridium muellerianum]NMM64746.1 TetR/AcrR family transcriptional regulator [Clostridium muellerianum]
MGTKERKEKEILIRKNDIIDAAEKVFFQKGMQQATMDEVAKEAEFSKRTVYVYFKSKEEIYYEIMLRAFKTLNRMINVNLEKNKSVNSIEKIKMLGKTFVNFSTNYHNYFRVIVDYENQQSDFISDNKVIMECYKEGEKALENLKAILRQGIHEGHVLENINIDNTAIILWSSMSGIFNNIVKKQDYLEHYYNIKAPQLIEETFEFMIRAILKQKEKN